MTQEMPSKTLVVEQEFPHSPEKVWRALTQPELVAEWLMQNDFLPTVGHEFAFRFEAQPGWNGIIDCKVLALEAGRRLSYTWNSMGLKSVVTWTLTPTERGVSLRMEQSGFQADQERAYQGAQYGWQKFLAQLEQVAGR